MKEKHDRSKYRQIRDKDGELLEAVFRVQLSHGQHKCDKADCVLGGWILPLSDYARVYYEEEDKVEKFHYGCFLEEFPDARRH